VSPGLNFEFCQGYQLLEEIYAPAEDVVASLIGVGLDQSRLRIAVAAVITDTDQALNAKSSNLRSETFKIDKKLSR
jgi:hypothetical protein